MSLSVPQSAPHPFIEESIQNKERLGYKGLGYNPALQWLQDYNQARAQLECELDEQAQKLAHKYDNLKIKLAKTWVEMSENGPRRMDSHPRGLCNGKPSRINKAHYISEVFVTTVWLGKNAPATTAVLKLDEPSNSPACLS